MSATSRDKLGNSGCTTNRQSLSVDRAAHHDMARTVEDDALLARLNRLLGKDEPKPTVEANSSHEFLEAEEAEALLAALDAEELAAAPSITPPRFPSAPTGSRQPLAPSTTTSENHCIVCKKSAHVWCVGCDNDPFCSACWREIHVGVSGGLRADAALRLHKTVPCRALRCAAALLSAPTGPPGSVQPGGAEAAAARQAHVGAPSAARAYAPPPPHIPCQTCSKPAFVCCVDCNRTNYCLKCWREIHVFPRSEIIRHRREKIALAIRRPLRLTQ
jgi:hypothetical protein